MGIIIQRKIRGSGDRQHRKEVNTPSTISTLIGGTSAVVGFRGTRRRPSRLAIIESPMEARLLLAAIKALLDLESAGQEISLALITLGFLGLCSSSGDGRWVWTGGEFWERDLPEEMASLGLGNCDKSIRRGEGRVTEMEVGRLAGIEGILSMGNGRGFIRTCCCSFVSGVKPPWGTPGVPGAVLGVDVWATEWEDDPEPWRCWWST